MNGIIRCEPGTFIEINRHKEIEAISRLLDSLNAQEDGIGIVGDALIEKARNEALRAVASILETYNSDFATICTPPHSA